MQTLKKLLYQKKSNKKNFKKSRISYKFEKKE